MKLPKTGAGCSETVARRDNTKPKLCSPCPVSDVDLLQRGEPSLLAEGKKSRKRKGTRKRKEKEKEDVYLYSTYHGVYRYLYPSFIRPSFCLL